MALGPAKHIATLDQDTDTTIEVENQQDFINAVAPGGTGASDAWLKWAVFIAYGTLNVTNWTPDDLPQNGTVVWPDGEAGAWTAEAYDAQGFGALLQYIITHPASSNTVRVTLTHDVARGWVHNAVATIVGA